MAETSQEGSTGEVLSLLTGNAPTRSETIITWQRFLDSDPTLAQVVRTAVSREIETAKQQLDLFEDQNGATFALMTSDQMYAFFVRGVQTGMTMASGGDEAPAAFQNFLEETSHSNNTPLDGPPTAA